MIQSERVCTERGRYREKEGVTEDRKTDSYIALEIQRGSVIER